MRKQIISASNHTLISSGSWLKGKVLGVITNRNHSVALKLFIDRIYSPIYKTCKSIQKKLTEVLLTSLSGQVILSDEIIREGSYLHSYNFLGTPQALFLLPNTYRYAPASFQGNNIAKPQEQGVVEINALENSRYELLIKGKPEKLRLNIYNESGQLIFSEQISHKGSYSGIYALSPGKTAGIYFEVASKNGVIYSQKF